MPIRNIDTKTALLAQFFIGVILLGLMSSQDFLGRFLRDTLDSSPLSKR